MKKTRVGAIGVGNMGQVHARYLFNDEVEGAELTAVCDSDPERLEWLKQQFPGVHYYQNPDDLIRSGHVDAVVISTPHYDHPPLAIKSFEAGLHVLIEKPAGVYTKQVREMNEVAEKSGKVFSIMYNQRTNPLYQKLRDLVTSGELGEIKRTIWIIDWYRPQSYYDSGGWRATWAGEGGGVLLNQDPHQLDLWQWTIDMMPKRIRSFCSFGKYHDIEVEDDVTAYVEYENGATGLFVTSTGHTPATNRYEIMADNGKVVIEDGELTFWRNRIPERQFNKEYKGGFGAPESWKCEIPIVGEETKHFGILQNWVDAIQKDTPLLAPGVEGIKGLTLSNAMHLSTWINDWVELPIDEDLFYEHLQEKIRNSKVKKNTGGTVLDVSGTH